jgi:glycosyltransferase involved in cell wall biosynthesis
VRIHDGIAVPRAPDVASNGFHSPLRLCVIGTIDRRKSQDVAVEAVGVLRNRGVEAALSLVGREEDPDFAQEVRTTAERLGIADRVRFLGEARSVDGILSETDILILSSVAEWTPLVLMEAQAWQKPVVASRVGGIPEVVVDRETGILTPPGDPEAIADAVQTIVADPHEARRMGARGREHVAAEFDISQTLQGLGIEVQRALGTEART